MQAVSWFHEHRIFYFHYPSFIFLKLPSNNNNNCDVLLLVVVHFWFYFTFLISFAVSSTYFSYHFNFFFQFIFFLLLMNSLIALFHHQPLSSSSSFWLNIYKYTIFAFVVLNSLWWWWWRWWWWHNSIHTYTLPLVIINCILNFLLDV